MADSRVFQKLPGIGVDGIGRSVQNYLRRKGLMVQGGKAGQGYLVQAKDDDSWKKISGMSSAIQVEISDVGSGILVNVGNGNWSDKVGAGVLGWFVFAPLAVTAIVGTVQQSQLPGEIFSHIERYIATGGKDMYLGGDFTNAQAGYQVCPHCGSEIPEGQSFCSSCGQSLTKTCPGCKKEVPLNLDFCPCCGTKMDSIPTVTCPKCGAKMAEGATFCVSCGTNLVTPQAPVPSGGAAVVTVVSGPLRGAAYNFSSDITIGRDPARCSIVLPSDLPGISRKHCSLRVQNKSVYICDHNSTSGTFLANGQKVASEQWTPVSGAFYLGSTQNMFSVSIK
ncbi:MAG: zinc ribbon domain-containing protein [Firmicutes bacterium]|nr:zinc ribbon domain-containing protein [[Eubacterium] siraeum]MCM1487063.1 zinc ribbon domain-containing protein [Bacillota bacterium]